MSEKVVMIEFSRSRTRDIFAVWTKESDGTILSYDADVSRGRLLVECSAVTGADDIYLEHDNHTWWALPGYEPTNGDPRKRLKVPHKRWANLTPASFLEAQYCDNCSRLINPEFPCKHLKEEAEP